MGGGAEDAGEKQRVSKKQKQMEFRNRFEALNNTSFHSRIEKKSTKKASKRLMGSLKVATKSKVISKGTGYQDKFAIKKAQRGAVGAKRGLTNAALNKLSQKHKLGERAAGMALTKAQKKKIEKQKRREQKRNELMEKMEEEMDSDLESWEDVQENQA